jgi:hypothetical protein
MQSLDVIPRITLKVYRNNFLLHAFPFHNLEPSYFTTLCDNYSSEIVNEYANKQKQKLNTIKELVWYIPSSQGIPNTLKVLTNADIVTE